MSDMFQYISKEGERWDNISYKAYGNANLMEPIIQANPTVPIYDKLPGGIILNIPILDTNSVKTNAELFPPWKR